MRLTSDQKIAGSIPVGRKFFVESQIHLLLLYTFLDDFLVPFLNFRLTVMPFAYSSRRTATTSAIDLSHVVKSGLGYKKTSGYSNGNTANTGDLYAFVDM